MSVPLTRNCRNTRKIHDAVIGVVNDGTRAIGPVGRKPQFIRVSDEAEEREALRRVLERLIEKDEFRPEQIAVLTAAQESISALAPGGKIGAYGTTRHVLEVAGKVLIQTIQRFKGLERPVVILAGLEDPPEHIRSEQRQLYVGMSRARVHLVVIGRPAILDPLDRSGE